MTIACSDTHGTNPKLEAAGVLRTGGVTALFDQVRMGQIDPQIAWEVHQDSQKTLKSRATRMIVAFVTGTP